MLSVLEAVTVTLPPVLITMFFTGFLLIGVSGFMSGKQDGDFGGDEEEFKILLLLGLVLVSAPDFSLLGDRGRLATHGVPGLLFCIVLPLVVLLFTFFDVGGELDVVVVEGDDGSDAVVDVGDPGGVVVEVTGSVSMRSTSFSFALSGFVEQASLSLFGVV